MASMARGVVANELHCELVADEFELQPRYQIHFRINILRKDMNPLIPGLQLWAN